MFKFFDQFSDAFSSIIDFFVGIFKFLVSFFQIISQSVTFLFDVVAVLPVPIMAGVLCIISVSIIYLIVGRK